MKDNKNCILKCPVCSNNLTQVGKTYRCEKNHTFDMGKQGYVNLHMAKEKRSKNPGDDKAMILSRKHFLEKGYYKNISTEVNKVILDLLKEKKEVNILDIGCGEGYYTNNLYQEVKEKKDLNEVIGIDISKDGIIQGAREYKGIRWIVGSGSNLPIKDNSLDIVLCMFSYIDPNEYRRVLKPGGHLVTVSTGKYHLVEIKEVVYEKLKMDYYKPKEDIDSGYTYKKLENIKYETEIVNNEDIRNLFDMTPYRWKSPREGVERLFQLDKLKVTIDVNIDIFEKK